MYYTFLFGPNTHILYMYMDLTHAGYDIMALLDFQEDSKWFNVSVVETEYPNSWNIHCTVYTTCVRLGFGDKYMQKSKNKPFQ